VEEKFLMVPGIAFSPDSRGITNITSPYVRASFSTATPQEIDEAFRRLSNLLKK